MNMLFEFSPFAPRLASANGWQPVKHEWYQVRPYDDVDLIPCMMLWAKSTRRAHRFLGLGAWFRQAWRLWRGQLRQAATWVYVQQGLVCGFISIHPQRHIAGLFVDPARQRAGIGSRLLNCVHETVHLDSVDVYSLNQGARQFYERHGFTVADVSPVDADGEPYGLLHMTRAVPALPIPDFSKR